MGGGTNEAGTYSDLSEADIVSAARFLIGRYGDKAEFVARTQVVTLRNRRRNDAAATWDRICAEIRSLMQSAPDPN